MLDQLRPLDPLLIYLFLGSLVNFDLNLFGIDQVLVGLVQDLLVVLTLHLFDQQILLVLVLMMLFDLPYLPVDLLELPVLDLNQVVLNLNLIDLVLKLLVVLLKILLLNLNLIDLVTMPFDFVSLLVLQLVLD